MITQSNAIYFLVFLGILFFVGVGFLIYGIRLKPKTSSPYPINPQSGTNIKTGQTTSHKFIHSVICEIVGAGLIIGGAVLVANAAPTSFAVGGVGVVMILMGFVIFVMGVAVGTSK